MYDNNATQHKQTGSERKPARIHLIEGEPIDAVHHIRTDDGWVCAYETSRKAGIDQWIPASNVERIEALDPSALWSGTGDSDTEIVTDGGVGMPVSYEETVERARFCAHGVSVTVDGGTVRVSTDDAPPITINGETVTVGDTAGLGEEIEFNAKTTELTARARYITSGRESTRTTIDELLGMGGDSNGE